MKVAEVIDPGLGMTFQDSGRPGWNRFGIPAGGYMDRHAAQLANALLLNPPNTTVLELTLQGACIRLLQDCWVSLTGANTAPPLKPGTAQRLPAGEILKFPPTSAGLWSYLAIPGGWSSPKYLNSSSTYERANLGPLIKAGTILKSHKPALFPFEASIKSRSAIPETIKNLRPPDEGFPIYPGPQYQHFPLEARKKLVAQPWKISPQSDRTGYRLEGPPLSLAPDITSEPVLPGSFQVPGNGLPLITMPDGPTVGGYPKIAWMESETLCQLAQCPPGSQICFKWIP